MPVATTVNCAAAPCGTVRLVGCCVMAGGMSTVTLTNPEALDNPSEEETMAVRPLLPGGAFVQMMV